MEEKTMTINELIDRINEAQALAYQQHIQANAIIINENFVKVPEVIVRDRDHIFSDKIYPPMICGLEMHFTKAELPDNTMFAVCEVRETERKKAIRQAKKDLCEKIKDYINDKIVEDFDDEADSVVYYTLDIDEFFDKLDDLTQE